MKLVEWCESLLVGHDKIDADHRKLVDLINQLGQTIQSGGGKAACEQVLNALIVHTWKHFEAEEKLMEEHHSPGADRHRLEHARLIDELLVFKAHFDDGTLAISPRLIEILGEWLIRHIDENDRKLAASLPTYVAPHALLMVA